MSKRNIIIACGVVAGVGLALVLLLSRKPGIVTGAVIVDDPDVTKQLPVANVEVTVAGGPRVETVYTDGSGFFKIPLSLRTRSRFRIVLHFQHPDYQPADLPVSAGEKLSVVRLIPLPNVLRGKPGNPAIAITNVLAQYSINTVTELNIGSIVKTFRVVNTGDRPCRGATTCSPDGKWKANTASTTVDAGPDNELHNARASCIAGPCPFTRIERIPVDGSDKRTIRFTALDWSDTATFLVEAEIYKVVSSDLLRRSYPLIFDRALTFTLPATAEGVSIQAQLDGNTIVFPLGPSLFLSWANCQAFTNKDEGKLYRCELKPGFRFGEPQSPEARATPAPAAGTS